MNHWWNILEKVIYLGKLIALLASPSSQHVLVIDLCLYIFFIWVMRSRLLRHGLKKYDKVLTSVVSSILKLSLLIDWTRYNMLILSAAIGMDILLVIRAAIDVNPFVSAQVSICLPPSI